MSELSPIKQKPLELVVAWISHGIRKDSGVDLSTLDGATMAVLVQRLIAAEVKPGGPYRNEDGVIDESLNLSIAALFRDLEIELPGLENYLAELSMDDVVLGEQGSYQSQDTTPNDAQVHVNTLLAGYGLPLRREAFRMYERILTVDRVGEISRIAELFGGSLAVRPSCDYATLGAANLLTWIAYSIYDDFLDEEGEPGMLPAANAAHRDAFMLYTQQAPQDYRSDCASLFRGMDEANAWELTACRFAVSDGIITIGTLPRYGYNTILAKRAAAHILGPLIVMYYAENTKDGVERARSALYDYLIARQFNDDLHDWVEDVARGHISPVVAYLIKNSNIQNGKQSLESCIEAMRITFWQTGLVALSNTALHSIERAKSRLITSGLMSADAPFIKEILQPIHLSLEKGLRHHAQDHDFYEAYRSRSV